MHARSTAILTLFLLIAACGGSESAAPVDVEGTLPSLGMPGIQTPSELDSAIAGLDKVPIDPPPLIGKDYNPIFPDPIPFNPDEWETNPIPKGVADARAVKGGKVNLAYPAWPPTIRTEGPNSRLAFLSDMHAMIFETLVGYSMQIQDYVPALATHWRILDDKMTLQFRLDKRARWGDGRELTADDVVATVEHLQNPDRRDPLVNQYWDSLIEYAKVLDKYTVEIKTKEPRWRSMILIGSGMQIMPAAYMRMDGDTYLNDWNWKLPPGTGPYEILSADIKKGRSISLTRRPDYWGKDLPENEGQYNFDKIVFHIVRDRELMYQKMLAGELDMYQVGRAQRWVDELDDVPAIQNGWIQMRKIYNKVPKGTAGSASTCASHPSTSATSGSPSRTSSTARSCSRRSCSTSTSTSTPTSPARSGPAPARSGCASIRRRPASCLPRRAGPGATARVGW